MKRTLRHFAALCGGRYAGNDLPWTAVNNDTRTLAPGQIYIALRGARFDGNEFLGAAAAAHEQANEQLRLHEEVLVPQARLAFESTLSSYQTGKTMFDSILNAETTYLRLQLDYYQYLAEHIKAIVDYEAILKGAGSSAGGATVARSSATARTGGM